MAHEVETMMYVKDAPWHGLGTYVGDSPIPASEAIVKAGLDWTVKLNGLFCYNIATCGYDAVDGHSAIVREFDSKILGVVGSRYEPIQNIEVFNFADSLVEEGEVLYHTAGSLKGGRVVWMLAKIQYDGQLIIGDSNDVVDKYLLFTTSHDGSKALRCLFTTVRVVCNNTLNIAMKASKEGMYIKHCGNLFEKRKEARRVLGIANQEFEIFKRKADILQRQQLPYQQMYDVFLQNIVPGDTAKAANIRGEIATLFVSGRGQKQEGVANTAWAALNAVTEYADYYRSTKGEDENRLFSTWLGSGNDLKQKAFDVLCDMFNVDQSVNLSI